MTGSHIDLNYRVSILFGPDEFIRLVDLTVETLGFDEEAPFDLVVHRNNDERLLLEVTPLDLRNHIHPQSWTQIHQILFSNHWIKGLNIKIQLVKRQDFISLSFLCEVEDAERRSHFINKLEEQLAKELRASAGPAATEQDRERLFGSLLMSEAIIAATRKSFLAGDFSQSINAAVQLLNGALEKLMKKKVKSADDVVDFFTQDPPRIIMPDLSGKQLQTELQGLGYLGAAVLTMVKPMVQGRQGAMEDPARVLKCLVMMGIIIERLDTASPNPRLDTVSGPKTGKKAAAPHKKTSATALSGESAKKVKKVKKAEKTQPKTSKPKPKKALKTKEKNKSGAKSKSKSVTKGKKIKKAIRGK